MVHVARRRSSTCFPPLGLTERACVLFLCVLCFFSVCSAAVMASSSRRGSYYHAQEYSGRVEDMEHFDTFRVSTTPFSCLSVLIHPRIPISRRLAGTRGGGQGPVTQTRGGQGGKCAPLSPSSIHLIYMIFMLFRKLCNDSPPMSPVVLDMGCKVTGGEGGVAVPTTCAAML